MMDVKVNHPRAGATSAWVPSPIAATLHAMHYHQINVGTRQRELIRLSRVNPDDLLAIPFLTGIRSMILKPGKNWKITPRAYWVTWCAWIEQGIGCSKVPERQ